MRFFNLDLSSYLIDLDAKRDPVLCYLDSQYIWVLENLVKVYEKYTRRTKSIVKRSHRDNGISEEDSPLKNSMDNFASLDYLNMIEKDHNEADNNEAILASVPWTLNEIKKALSCATTSSFEAQFGNELYVCLWKETYSFIKDLCEVLKVHLSAFWKTCKIYMDKNQVKEHPKRACVQKRIRDGQAMMTNVFELIQTMINYCLFLGLQDDEEDEDEEESNHSEDEGGSREEGPFKVSLQPLKKLSAYGSTGMLDLDGEAYSQEVWHTFQKVLDSLERLKESTYSVHLKAHPLIIAHYSTRIMDELNECMSSIKPVFQGEEEEAVLKSLEATVDSIKICVVTRICDGLVEVSRSFHEFEDWQFENHSRINRNNKYDSTFLIKIQNNICKVTLRALSIIVFGKESLDAGVTDELFKENSPPIDIIRSAINETMFGFLDGFHFHVAYWRDPEGLARFENIAGWVPDINHHKLKTIILEQKVRFGEFNPPECANFVETVKPKDFKNLDIRSFMTLCNLYYSDNYIFPSLMDMILEKFNTDMSSDLTFYLEISGILKQIIILNFAKRQNDVIGGLVKQSVFYSGLDWASLQAPRGTTPFSYF